MSKTLSATSRTLDDALRETYRQRWAHARDNGKSLLSQAEKAAQAVALEVVFPHAGWRRVEVGSITQDAIRKATSIWYAEGLSPATINKRLNCLSAMGISVEGCRVKEPKVLKWWLRPDEEERALKTLIALDCPIVGLERAYLSSHIRWTTLTGLRVEETLRLTQSDFADDYSSVTVPGLKTADSQATLPLGPQAAEAARRLMAAHFTEYDALLAAWNKLRTAMDWPETATLKALRRSAARYLHADCGMPLDMVRQYLRHEDIKTTMGYLRLTGGYGTEEMRRYLR